MKQRGILHPEVLDLIAAAGHGDIIVLTDAGLKVPEDAYRIDLALTCGVPTIVDVVRAFKEELVIEDAIVATEFSEWNPEVYAATMAVLPVEPSAKPHHVLMAEMAETAYAYVKTGECSAYASVALVCGVNYLEEAIGLYTEIHGEPPA
ncbi:MAG: D-ribose pyranase [Actinomycetota bacterium]